MPAAYCICNLCRVCMYCTTIGLLNINYSRSLSTFMAAPPYPFSCFFRTLPATGTCGECEWIPPTSFSSHIPVHWPSLFYDIEVTLTQPRMRMKVWGAWVSACLLRNGVDRKRCPNHLVSNPYN